MFVVLTHCLSSCLRITVHAVGTVQLGCVNVSLVDFFSIYYLMIEKCADSCSLAVGSYVIGSLD